MSAAEPWAATRESLNRLLDRLESPETAGYTLQQLEATIGEMGRAVERQALQDRLNRQTQHEQRVEEIHDAAGVEHSRVEAQHVRTLSTVFGEIRFSRLAYRQPGTANLHPADAALQLPDESYSYSLRRLAAIERPRAARTARPSKASRAPRAPRRPSCTSGRSRRWRGAAPRTSTTSTPRPNGRRPPLARCSAYPATARASS